jgi:hypothetical protein
MHDLSLTPTGYKTLRYFIEQQAKLKDGNGAAARCLLRLDATTEVGWTKAIKAKYATDKDTRDHYLVMLADMVSMSHRKTGAVIHPYHDDWRDCHGGHMRRTHGIEARMGSHT